MLKRQFFTRNKTVIATLDTSHFVKVGPINMKCFIAYVSRYDSLARKVPR